MKEYVTHIGIEVHVSLNTKTKAFCSCRNEFGAMPNTLVCPVCYGLPGGVPSLNRRAIEFTIMSGLVLGSDIANEFSFERKNFFSADMPKGYQLVQYSMPVCKGGFVELLSGKKVILNRIHLEEDSGRFVYDNDKNLICIDYNRSGAPVLEIVSEPVEMNAYDVNEYLFKLRRKLMFAGVSDCRIQEGGFRFDINLSINPKGKDGLGTRVELKNLNSSKSIISAIEYEVERQIAILESGDRVAMETRVWDCEMNKTYVVRPKEMLQDYRHFRDPDFKLIRLTSSDINRIREDLPESYEDRCIRYRRLGLSEEQIDIITAEKHIADFFDKTISLVHLPQEIFNWITTEVFRVYKEQNKTDFSSIVNPEDLATIITLIEDNKISRVNARALFDQVICTGKSASILSKEMALTGDVDDDVIVAIIEDILKSNLSIVDDYKSKPDEVTNFFVGQVLSQTSNKADPEKVKTILVGRMN